MYQTQEPILELFPKAGRGVGCSWIQSLLRKNSSFAKIWVGGGLRDDVKGKRIGMWKTWSMNVNQWEVNH